MATLIGKLSPSITNLIRIDHAQVLATFQQYHAGTSLAKKQALAESACLALELHAELEEEIFYPALRELASDVGVVEKSFPEHAEVRRLITRLRGMSPADAQYETTFMELMRDVMHHVADEETTLLPAAERLLPERLGDLGAEMTRRRLQQLASRAGELAANTVRTLPESAFLATSGLMAAGATLFGRSGVR
ncbi:MAG: hemerythrin domain-containing protein [Pseudomonadota bacterium]